MIITREMVDEAMRHIASLGMDAWFQQYLGDLDENEAIEAFKDLHENAVIQAALGQGPITTVTAGFLAGFEVAKRNGFK